MINLTDKQTELLLEILEAVEPALKGNKKTRLHSIIRKVKGSKELSEIIEKDITDSLVKGYYWSSKGCW